MPLYEYHCEKCDSEFELLMRAGERATCPSCGSVKLEKLISVPAASSGSPSSALPIREMPATGYGCGAPACQNGRCQFE